ncbi:MAG: hypothetical protein JO257_13850 [Deltaproteobacteria bacterium]|nr:hypothetical protein [Deltaproteobacteria bacterium]
MVQPTDTSAIQRLVGRARSRIRTQWALDGATTATVIAAAAALTSIFLVRTQAVAPATGIYLLIASGLIIVAGAVIAASRPIDDEVVARRIDRASGLSDRLSTAIAFDRALRAGVRPDEDVTHEMMVAAIRDGVKAAPRANIKAATPFVPPRDWRAAIGFLAISALAAGLALPTKDRTPRIVRANPDHALPGEQVTIEGTNLLEGIATPIASLPLAQTMGAPGAAAEHKPFVPTGASVYLGSIEKSRPVRIEDWTSTGIVVTIPDDAPPGPQNLIVFVGATRIGMTAFGVDSKALRENAVALEPDEKAYVEAILGQLQDVAKRDNVKELDDFANQIKDLLKKAENGEITKEQLLDALSKAEDALNKENDPKPEEVAKKLSDMGKELKKQDVTKDLGEALEKQDLQKAQQELEKLADKLDKKELSEQQKQELAKKLDEVAKQMEKQDQKDQKQSDQQQQKLQDEIRRLEQQKDQAKNDQQKQDLERRLEDKKRELQKLQKEQEQKEQSEQRRAVKRLQKDMEKAAENLQKPQDQKDKQDQKGQQDGEQEGEKQASQKLRDAARETGRVDKDQRKQATQKKMSSQMDDLREAMRRAKQRGNKGPQDPFNKQGKNQDFAQRSRGQKGQGQAWKPGQGQKGPGDKGKEGEGQGDGQQPGGQNWGTEHDDNLTGDPTAKSGGTKDQELQGTSGNKGGSTRETILSAAQKGFASQGYQKVYADYQRIVEEVMRTEKLPSSYKYYVKRYFAKIHPSMTPAEDAPK